MAPSVIAAEESLHNSLPLESFVRQVSWPGRRELAQQREFSFDIFFEQLSEMRFKINAGVNLRSIDSTIPRPVSSVFPAAASTLSTPLTGF